jgi:hypothetical protein
MIAAEVVMIRDGIGRHAAAAEKPSVTPVSYNGAAVSSDADAGGSPYVDVFNNIEAI